jgi:hypothetical protein
LPNRRCRHCGAVKTKIAVAGCATVSADRHGWVSSCDYRLPVAAADSAKFVATRVSVTEGARCAVSANYGIGAHTARAHHHKREQRRAGYQRARQN